MRPVLSHRRIEELGPLCIRPQQATKSIAALDRTATVGGDGGIDEPVADALVGALVGVVDHELAQQPAKMALAERDDMVEELTSVR